MKCVKPERPADPLSGYSLFQTGDVEFARAAVAQNFCDHTLSVGADRGNFDAVHNRARGQTLSLNYIRYGSEVDINPGELTNFYLVQIPLSGAASVRNGRTKVETTSRIGSVLNPTRETHMVWHGGCEKLLLQIDMSALHQTAERLLGQSIPRPITFVPEVNRSSPALKRWEQKFRAAVIVANQNGAFGHNVHKYQALFEEELISSFLQAQPSNIYHMLTNACAPVSSVQINRARAFICEKLADPITVSQIANAAGCGVRNLQLSFQQSFGCTPLSFLQQQRLDYAHMLIQSQETETLVSAIAYESGFSHLGRFSIAYRNAFGCSPSETVQQQRI